MTQNISRVVVLVGMMGSGKTTVGKKLANILNLKNFDSDNEIEKSAGMTISEIFDKYGEQYFREVERKIIEKIFAMNSNFVLSVGGGAFSNTKTKNLILKNSLSIWLDADFHNLCTRLLKNKKSRPLLNKENWRLQLRDILNKRLIDYHRADLKIKVDNLNVNEVVEKIKNSVNNHLKHVNQ